MSALIWLILHPGWGDSPSRRKVFFPERFSYRYLWRKCPYMAHEAL